jgi:CheY-like chemotaxis protein
VRVTKRVVWCERVRALVESGPSRFTQRASLEARAADGLDALPSLAASEPTDLVVLDSASPGSPEEICRRLRGDARTASIPILVLGPGTLVAGVATSDDLTRAGCNEVIPTAIEARLLQEKIAGALGLRLRRHPRFPVVLPVARGRIFHEFLGYTNSLSESGMGFDTIVRIRGGDEINLKIYRSTEEKPIQAPARVCGVRANIDTGVGYSVGVEFTRIPNDDRRRLMDLFPADGCVTWSGDVPEEGTPESTTS